MFVKSIMIPKFKSYTVQQDETLKDVLEKLEQHQIDALPVLNGELYLGVINRYRIYELFFNSQLSRDEFLQATLVKNVVSHQDKFLQGHELFENTLVDLKDFPLLAVVDEQRKFLGVVTRFDVMEQFQSAFGVNRPGVRIAFTSVETEGRIARLAEIAHHFHEHIISLVTFDETDKLVRRIVMKVEKKDNMDKFIKKLEEHGFRILDIAEDL
ncbi:MULTISPECIES: CBS domain-containing protein [unclassified Bacillus (in: firmicutes)]|uniref:CBS domain-containing protein n=1 Tax=unclassified Bacillus (in: firmicutes) TaxID=185979 RepID=UPI0008F30DC1|nr:MULTISPECIES: CBS domain-containing protein [unclassified Bacillus (in: firmicutes)]SFA98153.1 CBS domain-containing protein [Bacillus sp. UNCCL13]SFQ80855.1 CBS domain-containing protein [Bacillus sp. cl95]